MKDTNVILAMQNASEFYSSKNVHISEISFMLEHSEPVCMIKNIINRLIKNELVVKVDGTENTYQLTGKAKPKLKL
mgnify:CR=1 FL=1|tara:strand:- start:4754 stop:4981 length:228 start_codon:yes stop_codon:yes gene_type:complete